MIFFPKKSFIQIDPKDKHIDLFLKEIVTSSKWEDNLEAISKARELILNEYQLFPFLCNRINELELQKLKTDSFAKELFSFKGGNAYFDNYPFGVSFKKQVLKIRKKIISKFKL